MTWYGKYDRISKRLDYAYFDSIPSSFKVAFNGMTNGNVKAADV